MGSTPCGQDGHQVVELHGTISVDVAFIAGAPVGENDKNVHESDHAVAIEIFVGWRWWGGGGGGGGGRLPTCEKITQLWGQCRSLRLSQAVIRDGIGVDVVARMVAVVVSVVGAVGVEDHLPFAGRKPMR